MKIEFPTNLIEFILSGILIEASILFVIPDLKIENDLFWGLVLISGAYIFGLGFNSIANYYFTKVVGKKIVENKLLEKSKYLNIKKKEIETMFEIKVNSDIDNLKRLSSLMHNILVRVSEPFREERNYQMRLFRMSRTAFMVVVYWILFLILSILFSDVFNNIYVFVFLEIMLIFLAISLHLAVKNRISYIAGNPFSHFISHLKMHEMETELKKPKS